MVTPAVSDRLSGHVALVTGSTGRGLGTEIARRFAAAGAAVAVTGRDRDRGRAVESDLASMGADAAFFAADLSDDSAVEELVAHAEARFGKLTAVVNSAVAPVHGRDGPLADVDINLWAQTLDVNVNGPMRVLKSSLPAMVAAGGGSIVNVGSRTAIRGTPQLAAYSASKGALHAMSRSVAVDYARFGVRCNTVSPGFIVGKDRDSELGEERLAWVQGMHLTPPPTTADVALACLYLVSDESRSITGTELLVDGGGSMTRGVALG